MLTAADLARMRDDVDDIIADNSASITILRDAGGSRTTLDAQTVRIERAFGRGRQIARDGMDVVQADIIILGDTSLDIRHGDEFRYDGENYLVVFVRPNEQIGVQAEAVTK